MFKFTKAVRLLKKAQFSRLKQNSEKHYASQFIISFKKNTANNARLGIIVSKKVSKKAVIRNRLKRQIRESFRLKQSQLKPYDYVVIVKARQLDINPTRLRKALDKTWNTL